MTNAKLTMIVLVSCILSACGTHDTEPKSSPRTDSIPEEKRHLAENALRGLSVSDGLELQLLVSEPDVRNPTNIDVDDKGRIWVTEAYNYRPFRNTATIPEGDRIMIYEDRDGDGKAEVHKIFYQGPEISAPLGICVLENKVVISQSPYVWVFYDDNGDDKADRKEILFQGVSGVQHDHGMHSFVAGPDGKLYFNFGNEAKSLRDQNNKVVLDQFGDSINSPKYRQGMVFRCDPDGSNVERLAHNFRNNYEVAVDSYGTLWQSDNDDDGSRGVRINYVMEYGNFGYTDEMTGDSWRIGRTNMEDSVPFRHWHLNDPGVIPNLLQTGAGSPSGILVYEGNLLPEKFRNQMIHCEPGQNVLRAYPVKKSGAGYTATIENIIEGDKDQWFRPVDLCVAPDGSLIVADWYDPVIGGHAARDKESGRIYRIAPRGSAYKIPTFNYTTPAGAVEALKNPNLSVRRKAWNAIQDIGSGATSALDQLFNSAEPSPLRARAMWALSKLPGGEKYLVTALKDNDPDIRITALRAAREIDYNVINIVKQLVHDKHPQVLRESAIALHHLSDTAAKNVWVQLAAKYDGKDRWFLEALGIGAEGQWDKFLEAYINTSPHQQYSPAWRDIIWRSRTVESLPYLKQLAFDSGVAAKSRLRYIRAFDFIPGPEKTKTLLSMMEAYKSNSAEINAALLQALDPKLVQRSDVAKRTLQQVLKAVYATRVYLDLVSRYEVKSESERLLEFALTNSEDELTPQALSLIIRFNKTGLLNKALNEGDPEIQKHLLTAIARVGHDHTIAMLERVIVSKKYNDSLRRHAVQMAGRSWFGADMLYRLVKAKKIPQPMIASAIKGINEGPQKTMVKTINDYLSVDPLKGKIVFNRDEILALKGDRIKGAIIYKANCSVCHIVKNEGTDFGPGLTEIGDKLPKEGLLDAIAFPSAGISFGFETKELVLNDGSKIRGLLSSKNEDEINLKMPGGMSNSIPNKKIKRMDQPEESLMPSFSEALSAQDFANLLEYLSSLKKN